MGYNKNYYTYETRFWKQYTWDYFSETVRYVELKISKNTKKKKISCFSSHGIEIYF